MARSPREVNAVGTLAEVPLYPRVAYPAVGDGFLPRKFLVRFVQPNPVKVSTFNRLGLFVRQPAES